MIDIASTTRRALGPDRRIDEAVQRWTALLGADRVYFSQDDVAGYQETTSCAPRRIPAIVKPRSQQDVPGLLSIARELGVALYPISRGRNWGYGDANPAVHDCAVLDLSDLNRILHFDEELGTATIEPGVTQQQLYDYIEQRGLPFLVPVHGGGPDCSLLGNALERGYGITPHADHFGAMTSLEAVLADGRIYRSPLTELGGVETHRLFKWGIGPFLDGLFTQSNLAVVTSVTIALARRPEHTSAFLFSARTDADLEGLVTAVRQAVQELGSNVTSINLMNALRVLSMTAPYPGVDGCPPACLSENMIQSMCAENRVAAWTGVGALTGNRGIVTHARRTIHRILKPYCRQMVFFDDSRLRLFETASGFLPGGLRAPIQRKLKACRGLLEVVNGKPSRVAMPLAYWKSGQPVDLSDPVNPAQDRCGLRWYAPLVPMRPAAVREYVKFVTRTCGEHQLDPLITLTSLSERCFDSTVPLLFRQNVPAEVDSARACMDSLLDGGRSLGYVPYRLSIDHMNWATGAGGISWEVVSQIKQALDPDHILSPGRYCPAPL